MSELFQLEDVGLTYNGSQVLAGIRTILDRPQLVALAGPNGAGKSTLLAVMAGLRPHYAGRCLFQGRQVRRWARREFARVVCFVPQTVRVDFPFTAEQVVMMGRTPYCDGLFESPADWEAVESAMALTDTLPFRRRDFRSLSAGERQRVILASVLAQAPAALLLDEPTSFLDLEHQVSIYRLLRNLAAKGMLVVAATHDLNLAAAYADRILLLKGGRLLLDAPPQEALSPAVLAAAFGIQADILKTKAGKPWIAYGD